MRPRIDPPDQVLSTAAEQGGVISAEQLKFLGFNLRSADRLVDQRSWQRLTTGLYLLGAGEPSWSGLAWGGGLLGDLCGRASTRDAIGIVTAAVQSHRTTGDQILAQAECRRRLRHRKLLVSMLSDVAAGAESPLELNYLRDVERPHDLPRAQRQVRSQSRKEVRDMVYEEYAAIIELDGRVHIAGRFRDMSRDNDALLGGRVTLRYGWTDVTDRPCQVARQVADLLIARGWPGAPLPLSPV